MPNSFFRLQPHAVTRSKQMSAWRNIILDHCKNNKIAILDINEVQRSPPFCNASINRKLSSEAIVAVLEEMAKTGNAAPLDKTKYKWEVYWHTLSEWANLIYQWASDNGMKNTVCTLFEIVQGDVTVDEEFYGLDHNVLIKALRVLEAERKCELMEFDENQGVKFF